MGLLDKMDRLEADLKNSDQNKTEKVNSSAPKAESEKKTATPETVEKVDKTLEKGEKKVPQLKKRSASKKPVAATAKKNPKNDKLSRLASGVKKPDALANAKKTSKSSLHTHLNKTDQHGVSHKDRIEEELQAQVKKIKKIMIISVASLITLIFIIWLIVKMVAVFNSPDTTKNGRAVSYFQMKSKAIQYAHSKGFNRAKFDRAFEKFNKQASPADVKKANQLKARLLKERSSQ